MDYRVDREGKVCGEGGRTLGKEYTIDCGVMGESVRERGKGEEGERYIDLGGLWTTRESVAWTVWEGKGRREEGWRKRNMQEIVILWRRSRRGRSVEREWWTVGESMVRRETEWRRSDM